jgi:hypothetical protein
MESEYLPGFTVRFSSSRFSFLPYAAQVAPDWQVSGNSQELSILLNFY